MNANAPHFESDNDGGRPPSFDAALKTALHDVPVPDDLADRLIARLEVEAAPKYSTGDTLAPRRRVRSLRRRVFIAAGSLALVALVAVSFIYVRQTPREIAREELSGDVAGWLVALPAKNWRPVPTLSKGIEVDRAVVAQPRQWQIVSHVKSSGWSGTVTAIDLAPPTSPRAVLFVVRSNARFAVPSTPTATVRLGLSSGFVGTAWQRSPGVLYVLVVETDRGQRLEDFLRKPAQA
jgi:hypothetical protein